MSIYYVSGNIKIDGHIESLKSYVIADNKVEAKRQAKYTPNSKWKGPIMVEKSNIAFISTNKTYLINGQFYSDGIVMYDCDICPDWVRATGTADMDDSYFSTVSEVKATGETLNDLYATWHRYGDVYIQGLFHAVIEQNQWRVFTTNASPHSPLVMLDSGQIAGVVMPGNTKAIEGLAK